MNSASDLIDGTQERAVVVRQQANRGADEFDYLNEVQLLAESAGAVVVGMVLAKRATPHSATFIGQGKVEELREVVAALEATLVIVDHAITPRQERNLERQIHCRVIDRTRLILDIFALRASSREGKLQVELAQLKHLSTRLVRGWTHLERQKGGIGLRGPGETQLETDRRLIGRRIKTVSKRLGRIGTQRGLRRKNRQKIPVPTVTLVGYTNAGKSSLFNQLCSENTLAANKLFSTLDTKMRRLELPNYGTVVLSDTVGFIRDLPHSLITAFHATLEEVANSAILLHVVDSSSADVDARVADVESVLEEIGASEVPRIRINNKIDLTDDDPHVRYDHNGSVTQVWLSSFTGTGVNELVEVLSTCFRQQRQPARIRIPSYKGRLRSLVYSNLGVLKEQMLESGDLVFDLELTEKEMNWLNSNLEFSDEYWQIKPEVWNNPA